MELEIVDDDNNNLINILLTIVANWSPLKLQIVNEEHRWFINEAVSDYDVRENVQMKSNICKIAKMDMFTCVLELEINIIVFG